MENNQETRFTTRMRVLTQVYENYNFEVPNSPFWKAKGGKEFTIMVDASFLLYVESNVLINAIKEMIRVESNTMFKYEYRDHELVFQDEHMLDATRFDACLAIELAIDDDAKMSNRLQNHTL